MGGLQSTAVLLLVAGAVARRQKNGWGSMGCIDAVASLFHGKDVKGHVYFDLLLYVGLCMVVFVLTMHRISHVCMHVFLYLCMQCNVV